SRASMPGPRPLVDCTNRLKSGHGVALGTHLHADRAAVPNVMDQPQHERIVDLTGRGLVAAGMVSHLEITDQVAIFTNVSGEISLADLLVIDVEQHLDVGRADGLEDGGSVRRMDDELARMIDQNVEWFEDDRDPLGLDDPGSRLESGDDGLRL